VLPGSGPSRLHSHPLTVHLRTVKTRFRSANLEHNAIPSSRWCESAMKVFLTKSLFFTRFHARALTVFLGEKKFSRSAQRKTLGFFRTNERMKFTTV
jgi:hypothetical protein